MTSDSVCNKHYIVLFESVHIPQEKHKALKAEVESVI